LVQWVWEEPLPEIIFNKDEQKLVDKKIYITCFCQKLF